MGNTWEEHVAHTWDERLGLYVGKMRWVMRGKKHVGNAWEKTRG